MQLAQILCFKSTLNCFQSHNTNLDAYNNIIFKSTTYACLNMLRNEIMRLCLKSAINKN